MTFNFLGNSSFFYFFIFKKLKKTPFVILKSTELCEGAKSISCKEEGAASSKSKIHLLQRGGGSLLQELTSCQSVWGCGWVDAARAQADTRCCLCLVITLPPADCADLFATCSFHLMRDGHFSLSFSCFLLGQSCALFNSPSLSSVPRRVGKAGFYGTVGTFHFLYHQLS